MTNNDIFAARFWTILSLQHGQLADCRLNSSFNTTSFLI